MKTIKFFTYFFIAGLLTFGLAACGDDDGDGGMDEQDSITELARNNPDLSTLASLLDANPDLAALLDSDGDFTVFAPTNAAFAALLVAIDQPSASRVPNDVLRRVLLYHVIDGQRIMSTDITDGARVTTALSATDQLTFSTASGVVINGSSTVVAADVEASNGFVHVVDAVLVPELELSILNTIVEPVYFSNDFTTLTEAVVTADLLGTLTNPDADLTLFAPTNDAFVAAGIESLEGLTADDLVPILTYHVIDGSILSTELPSTEGGLAVAVETLNGDVYLTNNANGVFLNGNSQVTAVDREEGNGVVHTINRTLLPASADLVDVAIAGGFNELAAALTEAGLVDAVRMLDGATVFAPTDEAFTTLYDAFGIEGPADVDPALGDGTLEAILLYHVVGAQAFSSDLFDGLEPTTLQGGTFVVSITDGTVTLIDKDLDVADPTVTSTDVLATNGVIHVIDGILLPIDTPL